MRVLIVKLSSLGDVVHTYPAVTDALRLVPGIEIDWAVDEEFAPLARLHPAVSKVISLPIRRWTKAPRAEWPQMREAIASLRAQPYDIIIDAQGLLKSAVVTRLASGSQRHGFGRGSARETLATFAYRHGHSIPETEHMATRIRRLFAAALGYPMPNTPPDAGLDRGPRGIDGARPTILLLHGTSWPTKTWTVEGWQRLATIAGNAGFDIRLFAHGDAEIARADAIAAGRPHVHLIPPGSLETIIPEVAAATAAVTVDTGLGHLAAAFGIPTVGLYGPTNPGLTGMVGRAATELVATLDCVPCEKAFCRIRPDFGEGPPCLASHSADRVWRVLAAKLGN